MADTDGVVDTGAEDAKLLLVVVALAPVPATDVANVVVPIVEAVAETADDGLGVALSPHFLAAVLTSPP